MCLVPRSYPISYEDSRSCFRGSRVLGIGQNTQQGRTSKLPWELCDVQAHARGAHLHQVSALFRGRSLQVTAVRELRTLILWRTLSSMDFKQTTNMSTEATNQPKKRRLRPRLNVHCLEPGRSHMNTDTGTKLAGRSLHETKKKESFAREPRTKSLSKVAQPTRIALRKSRSKPAAKQLHIELAQSSLSSIPTSASWNKENNHPISELVASHVSALNIKEPQISPGMQHFSTSSNQHAYFHASPFCPSPNEQCQTQQTSTSLKIHTPQPKTPIRLDNLGLLADALKEEAYFDTIGSVQCNAEQRTCLPSRIITDTQERLSLYWQHHADPATDSSRV